MTTFKNHPHRLTMHFSFGQELRQEQKQILTQRMIQSMEILQLTTLQLEERINQELAENPMLELDAPPSDDDSSYEEEGEESFDRPENDGDDESTSESIVEIEPEAVIGTSRDSTEDFQTADEFARTYEDTIDEQPARSQNWLEDETARRNDAFANIPAAAETLQDHLTEQLGWFELTPPQREMVERIINNLDRNGYFTVPLDEFLSGKETGRPPKTVSDTERRLAAESLQLVRKLDPPGVGAVDLKDCLLLQITVETPYRDIVRTLIQDHLDDIRANRLPVIVRETGYDLADIQDAIAVLRHLNPRPGAAFAEQAAPPVMPDLAVDKNDAGRYVVRLIEGNSRHLTINDDYRSMSKRKDVDKGTRNYIKHRIGSAQWLIEAIEQRRETLTKVGQAIVDYQYDFFETGPQALKPLKMQQIADSVGVHVTTVSRACDEKWLLTTQGIYPLKRFFSTAIASSDGGETVAQDAVRLKLREIVDGEDKSKPLSDDDLVRELDAAGIKVARRTVVKYRQIMGIPNSRERKDWGA